MSNLFSSGSRLPRTPRVSRRFADSGAASSGAPCSLELAHVAMMHQRMFRDTYRSPPCCTEVFRGASAVGNRPSRSVDGVTYGRPESLSRGRRLRRGGTNP
jgi:hypothetical protein